MLADMTDKYFDKAYDTEGLAATRQLYAEWSDSYDSELDALGYATPGRIAEALKRCATDRTQPVLDYACGTGLSGLALKRAGFDTIDGADISPEMLDEARAKGVYRDLRQIDPEDKQPFAPGTYPLITATGAIGSGAAPVEALDMLMEALPRGGLLAFSFNDHTLQDPVFEGRVNAWVDPGAARLRLREHGPHLPEKDVSAAVYVLEKT